MKTKQSTKQRKQSRQSWTIEDDLKGEFGDVYNDDFLDEDILCTVLMEEEE